MFRLQAVFISCQGLCWFQWVILWFLFILFPWFIKIKMTNIAYFFSIKHLSYFLRCFLKFNGKWRWGECIYSPISVTLLLLSLQYQWLCVYSHPVSLLLDFSPLYRPNFKMLFMISLFITIIFSFFPFCISYVCCNARILLYLKFR